MKLFKKIIRGLLIFILLDLLMLLVISSTMKKTIVKEIMVGTMKNADTSVFVKEITNAPNNSNTSNNEINEALNNEVVSEILQSEEVQEMLTDYMDEFLKDISGEGDANVDTVALEKDIMEYIKDNRETLSEKTGVEITDEMIDEASEKVNSYDNQQYLNQTINNIKNNVTPQEKKAIKTFNYIISPKLRYLIIGLIVLNITLIMIIDKSLYKWIKTVSKAVSLTGISTLILSFGTTYIISKITNISINVKTLNIIGISMIISGIIVLIIYKVIERKYKKEQKNEIS